MPVTKKIILEGYRDLKHKVNSESYQSFRNTLDKLGDSILIRYKYCPDIEKHPSSLLAAKAIVAAEKQGKSEELFQIISGRDSEYTEAYILQVAEQIHLNTDLLCKDMESQETQDRMIQDMEDAKKSGLVVFPGLTIDGIPYKGAWDDYSLIATIEKRGGRHIKMAIEGFFEWGASAAAVLIVATLAALLLVNFGFHEPYEALRQTTFGFSLGTTGLMLPLEVWINDFLMAIFFLMIGLEIKKEIVDGELSEMKRAAMPVIGAIGGMVIPALIYGGVNIGSETFNGWGIPMATDIAFTLGLMALLGKRVPISLKIFISALAVADDLGAILVIALFYGHGFHLAPFLFALIIMGIMFYLNRRKTFNIALYVILGIFLWFCIFESGLHATLAGVITAILIPVRSSANLMLIAEQTTIIFDREIRKIKDEGNPQTRIGHGSLEIIQNAIERLRDPSEHLMHSLEKLVNYFILPIFAFFNTGILISGMELNLSSPGNLGILLGLVVGKPLGIVGACWIASRANVAQLSAEIRWPQLIGASCMAGVGFTMSIVVASSAFHGDLLTAAKISILIASTLSAVIGLLILSRVTEKGIESNGSID